jgi:hypothetical protein
MIRLNLVIVEERRISVSTPPRRDQRRDIASSPILNDDPKRPMRDAGISRSSYDTKTKNLFLHASFTPPWFDTYA